LPSDIPPEGIAYDLISGAGGCKLSAGRCDGTVTMFQEGDGSFRFEVMGNALNSVRFFEAHVYIGDDPLPKKGNKNGKYTNSPGEFPCSVTVAGVSSLTVNCAALRGGSAAHWLAFHAITTGTATADGQAQCSF
jgi:hypothetical protein